MNPQLHAYDLAGVNAKMEEKGITRLRRILAQTFNLSPRARPITDLSFFAALIDIGTPEYLAVCTDGVGTKLLVAQMMDRYDTIGIDCVAMNVNDVICVGATPVTIVDYLALQRPDPDFLEAIAKGLYEGAKLAQVSVSGGETAQVAPIITGIRPNRGFDLAATCVGLVKKDEVIVGEHVVPGDAILSLSSSGLHSNGYSLVRSIVFDKMRFDVDTYIDELGKTIGEELLTPTHIYVPEVLKMLSRTGVGQAFQPVLPIKALINITGNGLLNLGRIAAKNVGFEIDNLPEPQPIFQLLKNWGGIPDEEMFRVFNMGIGFCLIVPDDSDVIAQITAIAAEHGADCGRIGTVVEDEARRVFVTQKGLVQKGLFFEKRA